jgi:hypothetical protein
MRNLAVNFCNMYIINVNVFLIKNEFLFSCLSTTSINNLEVSILLHTSVLQGTARISHNSNFNTLVSITLFINHA